MQAIGVFEAGPPENLRLAAQLGFSDWAHLRHVDRPALMAAMPGAALLIFLLCAASFTIVLTLGGVSGAAPPRTGAVKICRHSGHWTGWPSSSWGARTF